MRVTNAMFHVSVCLSKMRTSLVQHVGQTPGIIERFSCSEMDHVVSLLNYGLDNRHYIFTIIILNKISVQEKEKHS